MKKTICLISVLFCSQLFVNAQSSIDFNDYQPLKCKGTIPEDFKTELSKLVEQAKKGENQTGKTDKKQEVEFAELSNYQLNNILFSGKVLYGDILTEYVNKVADVVLKNEPELRQKVRFYVLKNTDLNAYSTQRGIIFVSIGLLAQIENEAQLAFILCHEVVHFRNNHNLESYKKRQELSSNNNSMNVYNRLSSILNYSKEHELEADREGLDLFLKTPYSTNELNNLFDVMLYSYLPFDEIPFDTLYFNAGTKYVLPGKYFLKGVSDITAEEDVSDSMSSHPNIKRRREAIRNILLTKNNSSGSSFILSREEFEVVQHAARCELAIVYLQNSVYEEAFYCGYLLEKTYGKNLFTEKIICSSLYAMSKQKTNEDENSTKRYYRRENTFSDDKKEWEKIEGESQAVYYFIEKITAKELNILAARKMLECYHLYRDDFFALRLNSLIKSLVNVFELEKSLFLKEPVLSSDTTVRQLNQADTARENIKLSKIDKIKKNKAEKTDRSDGDKNGEYYRYAFSGYYGDSIWKSQFIRSGEAKEKRETISSSPGYRKYAKAKEKIISKYGEGLNLDKFIMLNPFYSSYIQRYYYYDSYRIKNPELTPLEEIRIEQELLGYFMQYAKKLELEVDIIGVNQQTEISTDQFNDYQQLVNWFSERIALGNVGAYTYNGQFIEKYVNQYGYIGFCYVINVNKRLEMVFMLFNLETGQTTFIYGKELKKGKPDSVYTRMMIYDILHQIKQSPDRINKLKRKYDIQD